MSDTRPLFIADSCIGGLSVLRSIRTAGNHCDVEFLADYAINPLGVKPDEAIAEVAKTWLEHAAQQSETLVIGCNTLSIRFHQFPETQQSHPDLRQVVSMVNCFEAMIAAEADAMKGKRVLIIGTSFTASQPLYPDLLRIGIPEIEIATIAATELERSVARFHPWLEEEVITPGLRQALQDTDFAVLACTCFPMAERQLKALFPTVEFLDPRAYCSSLLDFDTFSSNRKLDLTVTGEVVSTSSVSEFAEKYLSI
ncbi:aspartate/glutamate racemase family protein [Verrucomicrobiales bacterium]|nr:aspartate/glutamate racemase family protein [Verrucomicrobiales bacterium]MDB4358995.1 aspartate/glutamate racemase family protein [Verrucomicrobiales bacterium]